jgi:hypothetical protein
MVSMYSIEGVYYRIDMTDRQAEGIVIQRNQIYINNNSYQRDCFFFHSTLLYQSCQDHRGIGNHSQLQH